ncbi:hypothetical protein C5167_045826 [Papaver somniferum]|uniref:Protein kinase domain-containing protein n=1 Tax=Papaver somniferum TaxID=3469 RepID=A0A4Y7LES9_PAPSO|nr:mitogen-activated protein kinase kinase kinase 3-like [Papaver somniferum]RZC83038.1 hypothetical protein C5167_045826 [Papaver somniferum]
MTLAIRESPYFTIFHLPIAYLTKRKPGGTEGMWKREKLLGCGGQAQVFLASTLPQSSSCSYLLPPLIAVKSVDAVNYTPLMREYQILEELGGCESIIEHYGVEPTLENGQTIYNILLEFAGGGSLWNQIQTYGVYGLPETQVRHYTKSIILGLKHIHDHGYVHRDIKPDNILICKNNIAKIAGFGHSKKLNPFKKDTRKNKRFLKGTPLYMAPETVLHGEYGSSCDVWALGCVVLEMLTGKQAWDLPPQTEDETLFSCITSDSNTHQHQCGFRAKPGIL